MQAAVYLGNGQLSVSEVERPSVGDGEVLLKIDANTVCGTDLRIANGSKSKGIILPRILGHEIAGTVVSIGAGVTEVAVGDKVGMTPSVACNNCDACLRGTFNLCRTARVLGHQIDGGLAEYLLVPAIAVQCGNLVVADPGIDPGELALAEPLSCVLHGQDIIGISLGDVVLVVGGGAIGQLHAQVAKASGARTVIVSEPVASRRAVALDLGADRVVDPTTEDLAAIVAEETDGRGADVVIVCIGIPQLVNGAFEAARPRGKVNLFAGFPKDVMAEVDPNLIHYKELTVTGSSNSTTAEYQRAVQLIETGRINVKALITHRYSLAEVDQALAAAVSPDALKVVVVPPSAD